jgi:uncharacterized protein YjbI with pentapeptide repeats
VKQLRSTLRLPSRELIAAARDETAATIQKTMLAFAGAAIFCLLCLATPDVSILTNQQQIDVPFAGPVSFSGFIALAPIILIAMRIYLQIYVEHYRRLETITRRESANRMPTLLPLHNPLLRISAGFAFYGLLPLTLLLFTWKAAVLPAWIPALLAITTAVLVGHAILIVDRPWRWKGKIVLVAAIITGAASFTASRILGFEPLQRSFNLFRADLSHSWLVGRDLRGADLFGANLEGARLFMANLELAHLGTAQIMDTDLTFANLRRVNLSDADLSGADLSNADLRQSDCSNARFSNAHLTRARLHQAHLDGAQLDGTSLAFANLSGASVRETLLERAGFEAANLSNADFFMATFSATNLFRAKLNGASFEHADLARAVNLTQEQLNVACGDAETLLPPGLVIDNCNRRDSVRYQEWMKYIAL